MASDPPPAAAAAPSASEVSELTALVTRLHEQTQKSLSQLSQSLHNKVDRLVRQLDDVVQEQKKLTKAVQAVGKGMAKGKRAAEEETAEREAPQTKAAAAVPVPAPAAAPVPAPSPAHWASNLLLTGDELWQCFEHVPELQQQLEAWQRELGLRVLSRQEETLSRLYDPKREKLLLAVPAGAAKVALSVGAEDLCDAREDWKGGSYS